MADYQAGNVGAELPEHAITDDPIRETGACAPLIAPLAPLAVPICLYASAEGLARHALLEDEVSVPGDRLQQLIELFDRGQGLATFIAGVSIA